MLYGMGVLEQTDMVKLDVVSVGGASGLQVDFDDRGALCCWQTAGVSERWVRTDRRAHMRLRKQTAGSQYCVCTRDMTHQGALTKVSWDYLNDIAVTQLLPRLLTCVRM